MPTLAGGAAVIARGAQPNSVPLSKLAPRVPTTHLTSRDVCVAALSPFEDLLEDLVVMRQKGCGAASRESDIEGVRSCGHPHAKDAHNLRDGLIAS